MRDCSLAAISELKILEVKRKCSTENLRIKLHRVLVKISGLWACHATDGPPTNGPAGPSTANFVAINDPAGPSMAAMDGPAGITTAP